MSDVPTISKIKVAKLHGVKTIEARLVDNTMIIVGENGSGKTTFLRILYYVLSGKWGSLIPFNFEYVEITVNNRVHRMDYKTLQQGVQSADRAFLATLPPSMRRNLMNVLMRHGSESASLAELERLSHQYGIPLQILLNELESYDENPRGAKKKLQDLVASLREEINAQVLYLPTYRRIERELGNIFEGIEMPEHRKPGHRMRNIPKAPQFIELVEFGMEDVNSAIKEAIAAVERQYRQKLTTLTFQNLGDIIDARHSSIDYREIASVSPDVVDSIVGRIPENILNYEQKTHLRRVINSARQTVPEDEGSRIICSYFINLLHFQKNVEELERPITTFCELCSDYIRDKRFVYDRAQFAFRIEPVDSSQLHESKAGDGVKLGDLSSGEKQVVSLFSHLYLSGMTKYFVIVDEPELSLSVPWQRRFLVDIRNGGYCQGLIAVTHSPFIYDNELQPYAHSMSELIHVQ